MRGTGTDGSYDRPDREWRCGRLAMGQPCPRGPDATGSCQGAADCAPVRRGDRWHCTRPPSAGGPCPAGPRPDGACSVQRPPCVPIRGLSALRRRVTRMVVVAVIGLVMIALTGTDRDALLSPGPLTFQHSVVGGCAGCHQGFDDGPAGWVMTAFGKAPEGHGDAACHTCHDLGEHAELPHSRPPAVSAALTDAARAHQAEHDTRTPLEYRLSGWLFADADAPTSAVGCATCHREHRGVEAHLTEMPEGACQTCHTAKFTSFARGHPEFDRPLFNRRSRIAFDHAAHLDRHFSATESAGKAPETCTACHLPSDDGRAMLTENFETMCASCHQGDIAGAGTVGPTGISFLAVPGLDLRELKARGVDIGGWPEWSEEPLNPFMARLLAGDATVAAALERLQGLDLLDLRDAAPDDIRAVATMAVAVKRLIGDLLANGVQAAETRLAGGAADLTLANQAGTLFGHLPMDVLAAAAKDWFPTLASDLARPFPALPDTIPGPATAQTDVAAPTTTADQSTILAAPSDTQSDILAAPLIDQSDILAPVPDQSDILAVPSLDQSDILAAPSGDLAPAIDQSDILALPSTGGLETFQAPKVPAGEALAPPPEAAPTPPVTRAEIAPLPTRIEPTVSPEEWARAGGWYRGEFTLRYRPTGHADPFMRAWIDVAAATPPTAGDGRLLSVFDGAQAPGTCLRCHSTDRAQDGAAAGVMGGAGAVNWSPMDYDPDIRKFVRFAHAPHFSLIAESGGCQTCHAVIRPGGPDRATAFQDQYLQGDPNTAVVAGFSQPTVAICAECHAPGRAGDSCTQCHTYHVGTFATPTVPTRMQVLAPRQ